MSWNKTKRITDTVSTKNVERKKNLLNNEFIIYEIWTRIWKICCFEYTIDNDI